MKHVSRPLCLGPHAAWRTGLDAASGGCLTSGTSQGRLPEEAALGLGLDRLLALGSCLFSGLWRARSAAWPGPARPADSRLPLGGVRCDFYASKPPRSSPKAPGTDPNE